MTSKELTYQDIVKLRKQMQENNRNFYEQPIVITYRQAIQIENECLVLEQENEKLKKAIEILKDHVQFKLVPIVSNDPILEGAYHFGIKIDKYGYYATLPKIEAEVLKEVLENEL